MTTLTRAEKRVLDRLERDLNDARREGYGWPYRALLVENAALCLAAIPVATAMASGDTDAATKALDWAAGQMTTGKR